MKVVRGMTALRGRSRGQAMAEFALVAPLFFLLMFGIIQLGLLFGGQNGLVSATRDEARYAAPFHVATAADATSTCADAGSSHGLGSQLTAAMQRAIPGYDSGDVSTRHVTYSWRSNPDGTYYVQLRIHVAYRFPLYVPLISSVLDGFDGVSDAHLKLDATETMRIENEGLDTIYGDVSCDI
jgi:Flp pilus assembly protein TadG